MIADLDINIITRDVEETLARLATALSPLGMIPFMEMVIAPQLSRRAKGRFAGEGDAAVGGKWAPLRPATVVMRTQQGYGPGPINRRTGELENWVTNGGQDAFPVGPDTTMQFPGKPISGELERKVQRAQQGDGGRTVPRPVLAVDESDLVFLQTQLALMLEGAVR